MVVQRERVAEAPKAKYKAGPIAKKYREGTLKSPVGDEKRKYRMRRGLGPVLKHGPGSPPRRRGERSSAGAVLTRTVAAVRGGGRHPLRNVLQRTRRAPKMDGADPRREAPDAVRGRRARACRRSVCASARGSARGADPGSSSISTSVQRRVRPRKEVTRRLQKPRGDSRRGALGGDSDGDGSGATEATFRRGRQERGAASDACCTLKKTRAGRTEPHQGSGVRSPARRRTPAREVGKMDG